MQEKVPFRYSSATGRSVIGATARVIHAVAHGKGINPSYAYAHGASSPSRWPTL